MRGGFPPSSPGTSKTVSPIYRLADVRGRREARTLKLRGQSGQRGQVGMARPWILVLLLTPLVLTSWPAGAGQEGQLAPGQPDVALAAGPASGSSVLGDRRGAAPP